MASQTAFKQVKNNAQSTATTTLSNSQTSFSVQSGDGSKFPSPGNGFYITVWGGATDPASDTTMEIMLVTAKSGDTFTVTRGQLGTTAQAHNGTVTVKSLITDQHFVDIHGAINSVQSNYAPKAAFAIVDAGGNGDYTDIQSAINALPTGGGRIIVKDGTYTISASITYKVSHTEIYGQGLNTIVQVDGSTITDAVKMNTTGLEWCALGNMQFIQTHTGNNGNGLNISDTDLFRVENVYLTKFVNGVKMTDSVNTTFYNSFRNVECFDCTNGFTIGATGNAVNANYFENLRIGCSSGGGGTGIIVGGTSNGNVFVRPDCEPLGQVGITGISVAGGTWSNVFVGIYCEGNATGLTISSGAAGTTVFGGELTGNTTDLTDNGTMSTLIGIARTSDNLTKYAWPNTSFGSQPTVVTQAATLITDLSKGNVYRTTMTGNRTLANPTNAQDGQRYIFEFIQDATGTRVLSLGTLYVAGPFSIVLSTVASKRDFMEVYYNQTQGNYYITNFQKGY